MTPETVKRFLFLAVLYVVWEIPLFIIPSTEHLRYIRWALEELRVALIFTYIGYLTRDVTDHE